MSFPIVNSKLVDAVLETRRKPITMPSGSPSAREPRPSRMKMHLPDSCALEGRNRLHIDLIGGFGLVCAGASSVGLVSKTRPEMDDEGSGDRKHGDDGKNRRKGNLRAARGPQCEIMATRNTECTERSGYCRKRYSPDNDLHQRSLTNIVPCTTCKCN